MTSHPFHYERLVAERLAQIQRDMQLSRAHAEQQSTGQPLDMPQLATRRRKADTIGWQSLLRAS